MLTILLILVGLILLSVLVVAHEWGHMATAKKFGVEVEEFGIGFPPRAAKLGKKAETTYTLNWLPLGGFVKLKGESDDAKGPGTYGSRLLWQKAIILLAGVVMNWVVAVLLFTIVAWFGMPHLLEGGQFSIKSDEIIVRDRNPITFVEKDSPADKIGLKANDEIVAINGEKMESSLQLMDLTKKYKGQEVRVAFNQDGKYQEKTTKLRDEKGKSNFGLSAYRDRVVRSTWSAPLVGVGTTAQFTAMTFDGLRQSIVNLFSGKAKEAGQAVTGPVGIFLMFQEMVKQGPVAVLMLLGVISLSLAVMNTLPIPALDGGRLFVTLLFRAIKKPLTKDLEEKIHGFGMMALLGLVALITVLDILRASGRF